LQGSDGGVVFIIIVNSDSWLASMLSYLWLLCLFLGPA
jgi:hypothetical protein